MTLRPVAVTDLKGYVMLLTDFADGSDGLKLRYVQKDSEQMIAADSEVDGGLY